MEVIKLINSTGIFVEAHIADLHFGAMNPEVQFKILKEQFLDRLMGLSNLDIISINGDIFHHKFMANSDAVMYANIFMNALIELANIKGATVILIAGTYEHDYDQLKIFYPYTKTNDVRIVQEVRFEYIKGKRVLIIPELYGKSASYYIRFLRDSGVYDACYMHGTYAGTIFGKDYPKLDTGREPVFTLEHFSNCKGPIISGHNHIAGCYDGYFYYCGSPYRWQFGEEQDKGFLMLLHNIHTGEHQIGFEKIESFRYVTICLDDLLDSDPHEVIERIREIQANGIDYLKVQFTEENEKVIPVIRQFYRTNPRVKIEVNSKVNKLDEAKTLDDKYKEYEYLNGQADPESKLVNYINQKEGYTFITVDELRQFLSSL